MRSRMRRPDRLSTRHGRRAQHLDRARCKLAADLAVLHADLRAKAIWRERTQMRTSWVGVIGCGRAPYGGQVPNFSLYLCATQPGL